MTDDLLEAMARAIHESTRRRGHCWLDDLEEDDREACRHEARAALEALRQAGYAVVPQSALDWLHGSGPDANGEWFGEAEQTGQGPYWWRSHFRELVAAQEDT